LGIGGLGSVVMMNLLRLGIKKLILVDYDTVDIHNLNRQLMFSPADVGEAKVDAAQKNARFHNIANT
jgi:molybdopterin/thiamine biosynthesis adenylyltransferase